MNKITLETFKQHVDNIIYKFGMQNNIPYPLRESLTMLYLDAYIDGLSASRSNTHNDTSDYFGEAVAYLEQLKKETDK